MTVLLTGSATRRMRHYQSAPTLHVVASHVHGASHVSRKASQRLWTISKNGL
eukprot:m.329749 g.329749  ORF g.329749 m.329749 type:complete len:52 (+) comp16511_c1_seq9:998-1153(+)